MSKKNAQRSPKLLSSRVRKRRLDQRKRQCRSQQGLQFETLEPRQLLAAVTVGNALDVVNGDASSIAALIASPGADGISLREAITAANNTDGSDTITFSSDFNGEAADVIRLTGTLPDISESLHIDGGAQNVVITADTNGDDTLINGTFITDIPASETAGTLTDNRGRVLHITAPSNNTITLTGLTITGGNIDKPSEDGGGILNSAATLVIENSTISGNGAGGSGGGIFADSYAMLTLNNSTVSGNATTFFGNGGGISIRNSVMLTLNNSTVNDNTTTLLGGGGIAAGSISSVTLNNSTVSGNTAAGGSGGIAAGPDGAVTLNNSTVSDNTAAGGDGGGISLNIRAVLTLNDSTVSDNSAAFDGGGIAAFLLAVVTLTNGTVSGNTAVENGGGISATGDVTLNNSTVSGNIAAEDGGGIFANDYFDVTLNNSTVNDNSALDGGGIFSDRGDVKLNNSTVSGNTATKDGGGIFTYEFAGAVTLNNSTISGNNSEDNGGGIFAYRGAVTLNSTTVSDNNAIRGVGGGIFAGSGAVTLTGSTASGNTARIGGGILAILGAVTLSNSTVSGNSAADNGGGIYTDISNVLITNSTITGNTAGGVGGGFGLVADNAGESLTVRNSIIAGNSDNGTAPDVQAVGDPTNHQIVESSLIGNAAGARLDDGVSNNNIVNVDALLGPLADNGGPTLTHALLPDSPAIDAGDNSLAVDANSNPLLTDQRGEGFDRIFGGTVDIGTFEFNPNVPVEPPAVLNTVRDEGGVLARPDLLNQYAVTFNSNVNIGSDDLTIRNETLGGTVVTSSSLDFTYDSITRTAAWDFASLTLEPGFYSFELSEGITSATGNVGIDGDLDENPGGTFIETVYVALPGDANLDGQVNVLGDAFALIGNLGVSGDTTWAQGDFNGDGNINVLGDAFILIGQLGQSVVPPTSALAARQFLTSTSSQVTTDSAGTPVAFASEPASFTTEQEDKIPQPGLLAASKQLALVGSQDLDAAFESDSPFDDVLF